VKLDVKSTSFYTLLKTVRDFFHCKRPHQSHKFDLFSSTSTIYYDILPCPVLVALNVAWESTLLLFPWKINVLGLTLALGSSPNQGLLSVLSLDFNKTSIKIGFDLVKNTIFF